MTGLHERMVGILGREVGDEDRVDGLDQLTPRHLEEAALLNQRYSGLLAVYYLQLVTGESLSALKGFADEQRWTVGGVD